MSTLNEQQQQTSVMKTNIRNSDYMIKLLQIPECLSSPTTTTAFKQLIKEKNLQSMSLTDLEVIRQICLLKHQSSMVKLEATLWLAYLNSGTGKLLPPDNFNVKLWPLEMKKIMEQTQLPIDKDANSDNDSLLITWIEDYFLYTFNQMQQEFREELAQKIKHLSASLIYSATIDQSLDQFNQQHLESFHSLYDYRMKLVELNYREQILEHRFYQEKPSPSQMTVVRRLLNYEYLYEEAKQELQYMEQRKLSNEHQILLPAAIQTIVDKDLRVHLTIRHEQVLERYNNEMTKLLLDTLKIKVAQAQRQYNQEVALMWRDRHAHCPDGQLTDSMIVIVDCYSMLIREKLQLISQYKNVLPIN